MTLWPDLCQTRASQSRWGCARIVSSALCSLNLTEFGGFATGAGGHPTAV